MQLSLIAAYVAMKQTAVPLYFISTNANVNGSKNNRKPVILFAALCSVANCLSINIPYRKFAHLITKIIKTQILSTKGIFTAGSSLIKHTVTKTKSAQQYQTENRIC